MTVIDTTTTLDSLSDLLDLYEQTGTDAPKWLLDRLRPTSFDADDLHRLMLEAGVPERYAWAVPDESRNEIMAAGAGYYLHGVSGDGKTTRAASMLSGWLGARAGTGLWVPAVSLMPQISDTYGGRGSELEVVGRYASCGLLVVDDLGKDVLRSWSLSKLFWLLDARYGSRLPTVVTSQYTLGELIAIMDEVDPKTSIAIAGRMRETYRAIPCGDVNHRLGRPVGAANAVPTDAQAGGPRQATIPQLGRGVASGGNGPAGNKN